MSDRSSVDVAVTPSPEGSTTLTVAGTLDSSTYRQVRDSIIKAALDEPTAVLVDVSGLRVPTDSAWTAFTSARWHVSTWPDVPVILVCDHPAGRRSITRSGAARYVPVRSDMAGAVASIGDSQRIRRRASAQLEADRSSLGQARELAAQWLTRWGRPEMIRTASTVATVFVENVLEHTSSRPVLVLEIHDGRVTVAVNDGSVNPAARHEGSASGAHTVSGLTIVATLSRAWGSTPTVSGKTVWAVLGTENRL
ncbi:STAS domain-containing protein [Mycobacterium sp. 4D054]|uniref:STAS domain-containing protein n=1 Tax=Mycobacterium sp. 4D054 TaxID=3457440 RepID=UPI003FD6334C